MSGGGSLLLTFSLRGDKNSKIYVLFFPLSLLPPGPAIIEGSLLTN